MASLLPLLPPFGGGGGCCCWCVLKHRATLSRWGGGALRCPGLYAASATLGLLLLLLLLLLLADSVRSSALDAGAAVARRCVASVRQPREGVR
jgi:hypothetical protein